MVFITHDLSIAGSICDDLAVMYRGRFVEYGPVLDVLRQPIHPYTAALIAAVPIPDPTVRPTPLPARLLAGAGTMPRRPAAVSSHAVHTPRPPASRTIRCRSKSSSVTLPPACAPSS